VPLPPAVPAFWPVRSLRHGRMYAATRVHIATWRRGCVAAGGVFTASESLGMVLGPGTPAASNRALFASYASDAAATRVCPCYTHARRNAAHRPNLRACTGRIAGASLCLHDRRSKSQTDSQRREKNKRSHRSHLEPNARNQNIEVGSTSRGVSPTLATKFAEMHNRPRPGM